MEITYHWEGDYLNLAKVDEECKEMMDRLVVAMKRSRGNKVPPLY